MRSSLSVFSRGMLRVLPLACLLMLAAALIVPASATPPSAMSLSYDPAASVLSVTITHPVNGIPGHYIKDVKISMNGNVANETTYTSQPSDTFTYTYPLALKPGDTVDVTATCSLTGSATRSYTLPAAGATGSSVQVPAPSSAPSAVPGAQSTQKSPVPLAAALAGLSILVMIRNRR